MKYHDQYEAFKRLAIQQGINRLEQFEQAVPFGCDVPQFKLDKWMHNLLRVPQNFSSQRRYINRFKIGADPEFIFTNQGARYDARCFEGMQQGLAFGIDNNGRLLEIRPKPNRSAVEVLASVLVTLRWLACIQPNTLQFDWQAGAFLHGDGLGGHVHFGRKRPNRSIEVRALDVVSDELLNLDAYPKNEVARRRNGDQHHQHYGMPGDFRHQMHGYEYRTFPSWLDSPELAFLTLVLSKLAVFDPKLLQGYAGLPDRSRYLQRIQNLLSYYKGLDDDARLALIMINRKFPMHMGGDFKGRWGIAPVVSTFNKIRFIPTSIAPNPEDVQEMHEYLLSGKPLLPKIPKPTWEPLAPPLGYTMALEQTSTYGAKGLGELLWDVVMHKDQMVAFVDVRENRPYYISIPSELAMSLPAGWQKLFGKKVTVHRGAPRQIYSCSKSRDASTITDVRRLLLETVLPFWKISEVKPDSFAQWKSHCKMQSKVKHEHFLGKFIVGSASTWPLGG